MAMKLVIYDPHVTRRLFINTVLRCYVCIVFLPNPLIAIFNLPYIVRVKDISNFPNALLLLVSWAKYNRHVTVKDQIYE
jgi:hypothetical protein